MVMPKNDSFRTSDTALAAFLISAGYGTPELDFKNGSQAFFVFSKEAPDIEDAISKFDSQQAEGNITKFFQAYQTLLRRIRERY